MFFFNDTATTEIYTLSLHDALPISDAQAVLTVIGRGRWPNPAAAPPGGAESSPEAEPSADEGCVGIDLSRTDLHHVRDRKSTRLNSSHANNSYAVFCLKKKKNHLRNQYQPRHPPHTYLDLSVVPYTLTYLSVTRKPLMLRPQNREHLSAYSTNIH